MKIYPVIHVKDLKNTIENCEKIFSRKYDGVFLISMDGFDEIIPDMARQIKNEYPDKFVGINLLQHSPMKALEIAIAMDLDGTWTDNSGVRSNQVTEVAKNISKVLTENPTHKFFGSVAFKYQPVDPNPPLAAALATNLGMIPTTSGEATGLAAPLDKIAAIKNYNKNGKLALASGLTPENIDLYKNLIDYALVSTGISEDFHNFSNEKLDLFIAKARA